MKYLVNKETKDHTVLTDLNDKRLWSSKDWTLVEADPEGWVKHAGTECPLPYDCMVEIMDTDGDIHTERMAKYWGWGNETAAYRPKGKPQMEKMGKDTWPVVKESFTTGLLAHLKAAHQSAQQIPFLEAELRRELAGMGYTLGNISPFVEPANSTAVVAEPEAAAEPEQDMSDWRKWRDNDLIMLKDGIKSGNAIIAGEKYQITHKTKDGFWIDTKRQGMIHIMSRVGEFRFHSRPAKGE